MAVSSYFAKLCPVDKDSYTEKLTLSDGRRITDPYALIVADNIAKLPEINFANIYSYLFENPNQYSSSSLKAYKSLEAYNFFQSGHVQEILNTEWEEFTILRTKVSFCGMIGILHLVYACILF